MQEQTVPGDSNKGVQEHDRDITSDRRRVTHLNLCTTCRTRETGVPDCTSSQTCGATTVRANVHERPSHHRTSGSKCSLARQSHESGRLCTSSGWSPGAGHGRCAGRGPGRPRPPSCALFVPACVVPPIVAARDGDPRTPAEAIARSPRRARPRGRRVGGVRRGCAGRGHPGHDRGRAPAAAAPPSRTRRAQGRCRRRPTPATEARSAVRRGRQVAAEDPVLGDAQPQPPARVAVHVRALGDRGARGRVGPLGVGAQDYGVCASCHGASGEGGVGRQFSEGEVEKTFPHIEDQLRFVYFGTAEYNIAGVPTTATPTARVARTSPARWGRCRRRAPRPAATSPTTRSSPWSATSATRSAAPTRRATSTSRSSRTGARTSRRSIDALESGNTSLAALAEAGVLDAEGEPIEIMPIGDTPVEGSPPG